MKYDQEYYNQERIIRNPLYQAIKSCKNACAVNAAHFILHQFDDVYKGKQVKLSLNKKIDYICSIFNVPPEDTLGGFLMYKQYIHSDTFYEIEDILQSTKLVWKKNFLLPVENPFTEDKDQRKASNLLLTSIEKCSDEMKLNSIWFIVRAKFDFVDGTKQNIYIPQKIAMICGILGIDYEDTLGAWVSTTDDLNNLRIVSVVARSEIISSLRVANANLGIDNSK